MIPTNNINENSSKKSDDNNINDKIENQAGRTKISKTNTSSMEIKTYTNEKNKFVYNDRAQTIIVNCNSATNFFSNIVCIAKLTTYYPYLTNYNFTQVGILWGISYCTAIINYWQGMQKIFFFINKRF